jgi:hypothetical protein
MKIELLINGAVKETWDVPDNELDIPVDPDDAKQWDFETRCKHRVAAANKWIASMQKTYQDIFEKMGYQVQLRVIFGSKVNTIDISEEEMREFELLTKNKVYA